MVPVTSLIVAGRFWSLRIKRRAVRIDDYTVFFAYINMLVMAATGWWGIANGLGFHTSSLNDHQVGIQYRMLMAFSVVWLLSTVFAKLSVLILYLSIFPDRKFRFATFFVIFVVSGYCVSFMCIFLTNCTPISQQWDPVPGGYCKKLDIEEFCSVSLNMLIDLMIVALPIRPIWKLQMAKRNKLAILSMFSLGLLVVGLSAWRIVITNKSVTEADFVYGLALIALVSQLELWLGIIIACLPTMAPLFHKWIKPMFAFASSDKSKESGGRAPLELASHTIGSGGKARAFRKKNGALTLGTENDTYYELEEGVNFSNAEAITRSTSADNDSNKKLWSKDPQTINVTYDVSVTRSK